jgi:hypothetical protein
MATALQRARFAGHIFTPLASIACLVAAQRVRLRLCFTPGHGDSKFLGAAFADLLGKLSGERSRWERQLSELDGQLEQLPVAALLLAAFITYLPAHPEDVRERVLPAWAR